MNKTRGNVIIFCNKDEMTGYKNLEKWGRYIQSKCSLCSLPDDAGHMFLNKYQELVVEHVIKYAKQLSS